jgi:signal transduction histidine kinase/GAF domain-containing protein
MIDPQGESKITESCPGILGRESFNEKIKKIETAINLLGDFQELLAPCSVLEIESDKSSPKNKLLKLTGLKSLILSPIDQPADQHAEQANQQADQQADQQAEQAEQADQQAEQSAANRPRLFLCIMNCTDKNSLLNDPALISDITRALQILLKIREDILRADRTHQALMLITRINTLLNDNKSLSELAHETAGKTADLLDSEGCSIIIAETGQLRFFAASGNRGEIIEKLSLPNNTGIAGKVMAQGREYIAENAQADPDFNPYIDIVSKYKTRNLMAVPMKTSERIIGVIEVVNKKEDQKFTADDLKLLKDLAFQLTLIFEQVITKDKIYKLEHGKNKELTGKTKIIESLKSDLTMANTNLLAANESNRMLSDQLNLCTSELIKVSQFYNETKNALDYSQAREMSLKKELSDIKEAQEVFLASYENETPEKRLYKIVSFFEEVTAGSMNPISKIHDISRLFKEGGLSFRDKKDISADLLDHTERLERLVSMMYHMTRFICGKTLLTNIEVCDINRVLLLQLERLSEFASRKSCMIKYIPDSSGALMSRISIRALEHLIFILVDNSVKYCKKKNQKIFVKSEKTSQSVDITIKDEGIGIESRFLKKVFEPYFRVPGSSRFADGLGLGLALAKAITGAHGGTITLRSSPETGCSVKITLPMIK